MELIRPKRLNAVRSLLGVAVMACAGAASATEYTINFQEMADGAWGESAWQPLPLDVNGNGSTDVEIRGKYNGSDVYAYLDASTAGLGTCRALDTGSSKVANTKYANSGSNMCADSGDDNVNIYNGINEELEFSFLAELGITGIWFNNNHDSPRTLSGDTITIGSVDHLFSGSADDADLGWLYQFGGDANAGFFGISDSLNIQYKDEQFYISAVVFNDTPTDRDTPVPVPSTLVLLGLGLAGLRARKRRK